MPEKRAIDRSMISGPTGPVQTAYNPKFQLPAIEIPHDSLTEGTSIPPPKPSPPPSPPQTPISIDSPNPLRSHPTSSHSLNRQFTADAQTRNGHASPPVSGNQQAKAHRVATNNSSQMPPPTSSQVPSTPVGARPGSKRTLNSPLTTPSTASPPSKRQSIRKLLSLKSLANRSSLSVNVMNSSSNDPYQRAESPAPSTMTGTTSTTVGTGNTPTLKKRRSGAFWRKRESGFFGLGNVGEEERGSRSGDRQGDTVMGGTQEDQERARRQRQLEEEEESRRNRTPPPTLPEMETIGEGVRMDYGLLDGRNAGEKAKSVEEDEIAARRRPSGWFGGAGMFEGIR